MVSLKSLFEPESTGIYYVKSLVGYTFLNV